MHDDLDVVTVLEDFGETIVCQMPVWAAIEVLKLDLHGLFLSPLHNSRCWLQFGTFDGVTDAGLIRAGLIGHRLREQIEAFKIAE